MNKFIRKLLALIIYFTLLNLIIFIFIINSNWILDRKDPSQLLFYTKAENRMIVAAGSSMGSSFDSDYVAEQTNYNVLNVSFSLSHNSDFILNYLLDNAKEGDVVVFGPEYEHYYVNKRKISIDQIISVYKNYKFFDYLNSKMKVEFISNIPKTNLILLYRKFKSIIYPTLFTPLKFSDRGDFIGRYELPQTWTKSKITKYETYNFNHNINLPFKEKIIKTEKEFKKKGIDFYITFPPIAQSEFDIRFKEDISDFYKFTNIKLIGLPEDFVFNDSLILNHPYHTNVEGTILRSMIFVEKFKQIHTE